MMGFQRRHGAAQHQHGFGFVRLVNLYGLETAGQRRIFLNVFLYSAGGRADGAQLPARRGRLEQVSSIAGALLTASANQSVDLIDKQNNWRGAGLHLVNQRTEARLKFPFMPAPA